MKTLYAFVCISIASTSNLFSQIPDWSTSVASIIYNHCSKCHHQGGIAPFTLMSYDDAAFWGFSIQAQVNAKLMPPWPPDPNYNHLKDENVLTENDLSAINNWIDNGYPLGDIDLAPAAPVFNEGSLMLNPDETIHLPVFNVPQTGDVYWHFAHQSGYVETKYLNSIEFVAGNPSIVHHLTFAQDTSGVSSQDDENYPGPGYLKDFGTSTSISPLVAQSEGRIVSLPQNIGFEILPGTDYVTQVHYYTTSPGAIDSSKFNLKFCTDENPRPVTTELILKAKWPTLIDTPFFIPANTMKTFNFRTNILTEDKSMLGLGPHAHAICKSWKIYMVNPAGDTIPLISIPQWDFDWQGGYLLTKVLKLPEGSQIFGTAVYDNTTNNPDNPSNPPIDVHDGDSRFDEMAQVHFWLMDYQPGDEDIILDSAFYFPTGSFSFESQNSLTVFPNPSSQSITIKYSGSSTREVTFTIYNDLGEPLFTTSEQSVAGKGSIGLDCATFPSGMYLLTARSGVEVISKKFLIEK